MNITDLPPDMPDAAFHKMAQAIAAEVTESGSFTDVQAMYTADIGGTVYLGSEGAVLVKSASLSKERATLSIETLDMDVLRKSNPWMAEAHPEESPQVAVATV